jgi:hypothetical protein
MIVLVYLRLYGHCFAEAFRGIRKNPWTLLLPMALAVSFAFVAALLGRLGLVGGFIAGLVLDAAFSCYLYFTGGTVAQQKMTLGELKKSGLVYFWSVINIFFVLWIANLALGFVLAGNPQRATISTALNLIATIILNPAPEVIYSKGTRGGIDTISTCVRFLQENWIEWFIPNLLILGGAYWVATHGLPFLPLQILLLGALGSGVIFHVIMVFRGHLFQALDGSTHRQRMFKYRNAS